MFLYRNNELTVWKLRCFMWWQCVDCSPWPRRKCIRRKQWTWWRGSSIGQDLDHPSWADQSCPEQAMCPAWPHPCVYCPWSPSWTVSDGQKLVWRHNVFRKYSLMLCGMVTWCWRLSAKKMVRRLVVLQEGWSIQDMSLSVAGFFLTGQIGFLKWLSKHYWQTYLGIKMLVLLRQQLKHL